MNMKNEIKIAARMTGATLLLTGLLYPLAVTGLARVMFPRQAAGSFVEAEGRTVGSTWIGQSFKSPAYFQGRLSAAGAEGYDAAASSGSNLGPASKKLRDRVAADVARLQTENPQAPGPVPEELVTTSASGLDPHLSPDAARWQVPRVAAARHVAAEEVRAVLDAQAEGRTWGFLGEPRVNVLELNLELDRHFGKVSPAGS